MRLPSHSLRSLGALAAVGAALLAAGCGDDEPDLANGKKLFVGEGTCGSCHALERAGTKGTVGPDLDSSFSQLLRDGMERTTIEGTVENQIAHPRRSSTMKPGLVKGQDARDVAAYVAYAAARPGKDEGLLASAAQPKKGPPIAAKGGTLTIPADPTGALTYTSERRTRPRERSRSRRRTSRRSSTTSPSSPAARSARWSAAAATPPSRQRSSRASTPSTARCPATRPAA